VWVLINNDKEVVKKFTVPSTRAAIPNAVKALNISPQDLPTAIEPVCGWRWYSEALEEEGLAVSVANPQQVRLIADSKNKHDAYDARMLAELLHIKYLPTAYRAPDDIAAWRSLVRERGFIMRLSRAVKSRVHGIVLRNGYLEGGAHALRKMHRKTLDDTNDPELIRTHKLLELIEAHALPMERELEQLVKNDAISRTLMTMPGVGIITASAIRAEVGDFTRFDSGEKLASYAGLVPSQRSSGQSVRMGHITKQGPTVLRYTMVECAYRVRSHHPLYAFYDRLAPKVGKKKARIALARKMLVILWHMVHTNKPFDSTQCMTNRGNLSRTF
jgi:transposase